uniref:p57 n=1 Tax=Saccharolobus solfataricus TaxID=2287 RepID=Q6PN93_SACSO|nr:p57 [Saccharolobus solfataricus]
MGATLSACGALIGCAFSLPFFPPSCLSHPLGIGGLVGVMVSTGAPLGKNLFRPGKRP